MPKLFSLFQNRSKKEAFTLTELIVTVTILAILATIGFLAFSGYQKDAKTSTTKANLKALVNTIAIESAKNDNSPRSYVFHNSVYALSGVVLSGVALLPGAYGSGNYTAGTADFTKLRLDPSKFKDVNGNDFIVGSVDITEVLSSGKNRTRSFFQVAGEVSDSKMAIDGTYPGSIGSGDLTGLIKSPVTGTSVENDSVGTGLAGSTCILDARSIDSCTFGI